MKVLMFGWEFPPHQSGGLGTACYGLTKALASEGISIDFVVPKGSSDSETGAHLKLISALDNAKMDTIKFVEVKSSLKPYMTSAQYASGTGYWMLKKKADEIYGSTLFEEVMRYAEIARLIADDSDFNVIHCHDWMTFPAGINVKKKTGKPLIVHVHATEFDRTGGNSVNWQVYNIEKQGMNEADVVITVSNFTKEKVIKHYNINPDKIIVVHNGVEFTSHISREECRISADEKVVLFLGRITLQKGPEYFINAAKKVVEHYPDVKFVVAGSGDMEYRMIEHAAALGLGNKVLFAGFLKGKDIDRAYRMADLYVMPSVSEPFGITPLEAMRNNTPVIISKQSGVSEVINSCIKVDFWDIDAMANKMIGVLKYNQVQETLAKDGAREVKRLGWKTPARKCAEIYATISR